jgi:hypothetical protein
MTKPVPFFQDPDFWRPQTYYVLAAVASIGLTYLLPLWMFTNPEATASLFANRLLWQTAVGATECDALQALPDPSLPLFVLTGMLVAELLMALAFYKNLKLQPFLLLGAATTSAAVLGVSYMLFSSHLQTENTACEGSISLSLGSAGLVAVALLCVGAIRLIAKDAQTLKRMDRFW